MINSFLWFAVNVLMVVLIIKVLLWLKSAEIHIAVDRKSPTAADHPRFNSKPGFVTTTHSMSWLSLKLIEVNAEHAVLAFTLPYETAKKVVLPGSEAEITFYHLKEI